MKLCPIAKHGESTISMGMKVSRNISKVEGNAAMIHSTFSRDFLVEEVILVEEDSVEARIWRCA